MTRKHLRKKKLKIAFNVLYVKNWTYVMPSFEKITQIVKTTYSFNDSKQIKIQFYSILLQNSNREIKK